MGSITELCSRPEKGLDKSTTRAGIFSKILWMISLRRDRMGFPSLDSNVAMDELSADALTLGSTTSKREAVDRPWSPSFSMLTTFVASMVIRTSLASAEITRASKGEVGSWPGSPNIAMVGAPSLAFLCVSMETGAGSFRISHLNAKGHLAVRCPAKRQAE